MLKLGEIDPKTGEYIAHIEPNRSTKLIELNGKKYIFSKPPDNVRPRFSPAPIISTVSEAHRQKEEIRQIIKSLRLKERRILQMMGCLNMYLYLIAKDWQAIQKTHENSGFTYQINHDRLHSMIAFADQGELENSFPSTYVVEYLSEHWNVSCDRRSYWGVREFFRNYLILFDFQPGVFQTRKISLFKQINYRRMLLTYEVLEEELNERSKHDLLPEHLGSNVVNIYNAVFLGFLKYRRKWKFDFGAPIHEDSMQRPIKKDVLKPTVRTLAKKSWSELTGKVWDSEQKRWVRYFKTKNERDTYLSRQRGKLHQQC